MPDDFLFADRKDAAIQLSKALIAYRGSNTLVMAVPRGGVPVGAVVARRLDLPLEIIMVKKLGHPANPEFAIGSVSLRGVRIDRASTDVSEDYIRQETGRIRKELERRQTLFCGSDTLYPVTDKTVILVDDGIATGSTLLAAIDDLREAGAARIVVAVPVAPPAAANVFQAACDEYIVLHEPRDFSGVGQFYANFGQVSDEEAASILKAFRNQAEGSH
jgi:predicted phosphoribosyltransferase